MSPKGHSLSEATAVDEWTGMSNAEARAFVEDVCKQCGEVVRMDAISSEGHPGGTLYIELATAVQNGRLLGKLARLGAFRFANGVCVRLPH